MQAIRKKLETYTLSLKAIKTLWQFPPSNWVKYKTDGASRCNPGPSSYEFRVRDEKCDLLYAEYGQIKDTTSTLAKIKSLLYARKHFNKATYNQVIFQTNSLVIYKVMKKMGMSMEYCR